MQKKLRDLRNLIEEAHRYFSSDSYVDRDSLERKLFEKMLELDKMIEEEK